MAKLSHNHPSPPHNVFSHISCKTQATCWWCFKIFTAVLICVSNWAFQEEKKNKNTKPNCLDLGIFPENLKQKCEVVSLLCFLMCLKLTRTTFSYHFTDVALFLHPFNPLSSSYVLRLACVWKHPTEQRAWSILDSGHCCNAATNSTTRSLASGVSAVQDGSSNK